MPGHEQSADSGTDGHDGGAGVLIVVVRTGGFAGIRRRWRVEPDPAEQPQWTALVERCPWDAPAEHPDEGADRFVWTVHARIPDAELQRELPDSAVTGAWRELVEAVREAGGSGGAGSPDRAPDAPGRGPYAEPSGPAS